MRKEGIAIIGAGCRFPGGVKDLDTFWDLLVEGRDAVSEIPADRWNVERYYDEQPGLAGKSMAKRGGFVEGLAEYDPQFFGISPREAPHIDPQQRLLLETAWEAIEEAGIILDFEKGTDIGVFVGISHNDYQVIQGTPWDSHGITAHSPTGSAHSIAANRISFCLNLTGPSVAMDTACSSALTAVHAACEHIWAGRGEVALAGGVTVMITPGGFIGFSQASMLSPDGRCAAFDASANGFVRGEGAGMVLLKKLSAALADGDPIQGVIVGSSINQDGHTNGIMLPSPDAQARLVKDACRDAGVTPNSIHYVEAHGTGTAVGDPIEAHALAEALCADRPADEPLPMGSVKTNLGHLETAAGIAGLLKAMLVLKKGQIPPSLHFETPNPNIDFAELKLRIPTKLEPLHRNGGPLMAGVNSFGFGGANAHVILAEAPPQKAKKSAAVKGKRGWPLVLSARSEEALKGAASRLADWLKARPAENGAASVLLADLAFTLGARRNHHPYRLTLVGHSPEQVVEELSAFAAGESSLAIKTSFTPRPESPLKIAFVMSGQGPQWWGMGRELMEREPVFRKAMKAVDAAMKPHARFSLLTELAKSKDDSQIGRTEIAQPAIFAIQYALAELWKSRGITPAAIVGHSVGEIAAACVAGVLSLEKAARVIAMRGRFMENCARGAGAMLAVSLDEQEAAELIAKHDRGVRIAAYNGPRSLTMAGLRTSLEAIAAELEPRGVFARFVKVDHPFHHPMMQPASEELENALESLVPQPETVPIFSTVTGERQRGEDFTALHWGSGVREPVQFVAAVNAIADFGVDVWLELSAHPALALSINECLAERGTRPLIVSSARRENEHEYSLEAALDLHRGGVVVDFTGLTPSRRQLGLPAYAWDKARWWSEAPDWKEGRLLAGGRGLLDVRLPRSAPTWSARLDDRHMQFLKDHKVDNLVVFPAAGYVEMALEAGQQIFEGRPFVIEDFEIRKPLIIPEQPSDVTLELAYDPIERTFTIQSRMGQRAAWSVHVQGSMRAERTESPFASSTWSGLGAPGLAPVEVGGFYQHMFDMGLKYGSEFRPLRELAAGQGSGAGRLELGEAALRRAAAYPLHPVLLDGALHVFSAGAATVEDRKARMKLPVRFARILFLGSPGTSALVHAKVSQFSDEFIEGDVGIYDAAGKPCVLVDGFRAISLANVRKSSAPGGTHDLVYNIEWERTPTAQSVSAHPRIALADLQATAGQALDTVISLRGREKLEATMAAEDDLAAAQVAGGLARMGVKPGTAFSAESLKITGNSQKLIFARLADKLTDRGLLTKSATGYTPTAKFTETASAADATLRAFLEKHPGHLVEGMLCASTCAELGAILRGEKDAVQILFSGANSELLDQFYGDGLFASHWMAAIASAVQEAARRLPEGRGLRILEVGAGTAGLAATLLPLLQRGLHSYVFTDVSAAFFSAAGQKLAGFPEVEYKVLDLERDPLDQGFEAETFDFVLGTNVLHAVSDVRAALRGLHNLLAPGATLMFMDVATAHLWTESVFGLTPGWWSFTDRDLRTESPLLKRDQWEKALRDAGFAETASLSGLRGPLGEGQIGLLARREFAENIGGELPMLLEKPAEKSWLIFADESGLSSKLAEYLGRVSVDYTLVRQSDLAADQPSAWISLLKGSAAPERIVYLWTLDQAPGEDAVMGTDALLHLSQAIAEVHPSAKIRFDLVTRGAQPAGEAAREIAMPQTPSIGIFRVILSENANLTCRGVDLPPEPAPSDLPLLWTELLRTESDREVALRGEARYIQRIVRGLPKPEQWLDPQTPLRLECRERGLLDSLAFAPFTQPECAPGEVLIRVQAAGMNFRDVLKALALYPAETPDARVFGDEVAGTIIAVGADVKHVAPGDKVFGLAVFGLATHALARGGDVRRMPAQLSFEEAATIPVVYMTAWHAINNVARMRKGETILVHAGAGGVGMAAIQIAHHLGVEVIASAGSPAKRALLTTLGVKHVIDSRKGDFAEAVMALTNRRGVDCVLNALSGEAIPMGLSCLAEFGRFIEIGKRDIYQNSRIPLWPLRKNASFSVVAMDAVFNGDEALTRDMLAEVAAMVESGTLNPLPFRAFPACRVDAAFRLMASGKHTGKVVVSFAEPMVLHRGQPLPRGFSIKADGAYLITGAFGGFGKVLASWLADCGARNLVLAGRSGASSPEAKEFVKSLEGRGVTVRPVAADVGTPTGAEMLLKEARASGLPLTGVFHLAMVIDDAPLAALDRDRFAAVMAPKARGAWLLHEATKSMDLDCFVMFSSVSSIFGNPAQGNYAAANAFLDALAHHRRALGLPALTVNWGVLGEEGFVARNEKVAEFLARQGTSAISPGEVTALLESFLTADAAQVAAIRVDWAKWRQFFRGLQQNSLLERIFANLGDGEEAEAGSSDWKYKLEAAAPAERPAIVGQAIREIVGSVLRVKPETLRDDQPLTDLGLDSLMGVEIENSIEIDLGVSLPPTSLLRARTIGQITARIVEHLGGPPVDAQPAVEAAPASSPDSAADALADVDLDALSDGDLSRLLGETELPKDLAAVEEPHVA